MMQVPYINMVYLFVKMDVNYILELCPLILLKKLQIIPIKTLFYIKNVLFYKQKERGVLSEVKQKKSI